MRNLESGQQIKQNKQMPKWQLFNQIAKILPLQTTQLQIVACHFFSKKTLYRSVERADLHL